MSVPAVGPTPRLLFVVRGAEDYGTYRQVVGSMEGLRALGCTVGLYALGEGGLVERTSVIPGVTVVCDPQIPPRFVVSAGGRGMGKLRSFARLQFASVGMIVRLRRYLRAHRYDALVICEHGLTLPMAAVGRLSGLKTIWLMANLISTNYPLDLNRRLYAFAFRHLGAVPIANSAFTLQTLGRGASYAKKIDLGVDPADMNASIEGASIIPGSIPPGAVKLLVMGRMVPNKGQLVLLRALLSDAALAGIHLILCGGPLGTSYEAELRREAELHEAADRLHIVGPVRDVRGYYEQADVVANARLDPEPFGLSVVEAMIAGKPVLAHALGGPAETVIDGKTGWHVMSPTPEAFADGLRRMLADRSRWPAMGRAGADRAAATYSIRVMSEQLLRAIRASLPRASSSEK